jgi:hypothetical protein
MASTGAVWSLRGAAMRKEDALKILQAKLAEIEQEHDSELAESEGLREPVDTKAEARALSAVFDYLQNCKLTPTESLLRVFRRYLRAPKARTPIAEEGRAPRSKAG